MDITQTHVNASSAPNQEEEFELESIHDEEVFPAKPEPDLRKIDSSSKPTNVSSKVGIDPHDNIERDYQNLITGTRNSRDATPGSDFR